MAVTSREQQMIDLAEAGHSYAQIGDRLGVDPKYVRARLSFLSGSPAEDVRRERAIARGSAQLLAAVLQAGGHH